MKIDCKASTSICYQPKVSKTQIRDSLGRVPFLQQGPFLFGCRTSVIVKSKSRVKR